MLNAPLEVRQRISASNIGKPAWNKGKHHSAETRERLSVSHKGQSPANKGKHPTEETRAKLSAASKNPSLEIREKMSASKSLEWVVIDPDGHEAKIVNLQRFCLEHNLNRSAMGQVAYGYAKHHKGWKCRRA